MKQQEAVISAKLGRVGAGAGQARAAAKMENQHFSRKSGRSLRRVVHATLGLPRREAVRNVEGAKLKWSRTDGARRGLKIGVFTRWSYDVSWGQRGDSSATCRLAVSFVCTPVGNRLCYLYSRYFQSRLHRRGFFPGVAVWSELRISLSPHTVRRSRVGVLKGV